MRDDRERMHDIVETAARVTELVSRGRALFDSDAVVQDAMIRRLEVIGEAASKVSGDTRSRHPEVPWGQAAAVRNRTAHGYVDVDLQQVWVVAIRDIPVLAEQVQRILDETS